MTKTNTATARVAIILSASECRDETQPEPQNDISEHLAYMIRSSTAKLIPPSFLTTPYAGIGNLINRKPFHRVGIKVTYPTHV